MEELLWLRLFGGGFGTGFDVTALLAFVAFAVIYLIVPLIGFTPERPAGLATALYLLIGYAGLSLIQLIVQWTQLLDSPGSGPFGRGPAGVHVLFVFSALKLVVFLIAMIMFVSGLRAVRLRRPESEAPSAAEELQRLREENVQLRKQLAEGGSRGQAGIQEDRL